MNNHIQLVLKSSTTEMSLNDHDSGIYIVPELEGLTGLPSIRTTSGVNSGYDGGWTSAQNFDARSITIRGVIASTDVATVERMRKQLIALLAQGKNEPLTLNLVTEAGNAYELEVRTIACEMAMQTVLQQQEFLIQLRADDPLIYDSSAGGESVLVQVQHAIGGFEINFELPLAISGGEGESIIENAGLEKVYPVISMYGALHNPTFVNATTNQQIQVNATLGFAEGEWNTPSDVYEGKAITIDDAPAEAPLASFQLDGETSQNGTPTPSAPVAVNTTTGENVVKICGKNLLEYESRFIPYSNYGLTTTMDATTGIITINGTFTGTSAKDIALIANSVSINISQNNSYYIGIKYISGSKTGDSNFTARTVLSSGSYYWNNAVPLVHEDRSVLCNIGNAVRFDTIRFFVPVGATFDNYKILPYINANETGYEPYQGQSYEVNLGKNLCDLNAAFPLDINGVTVTKEADGSVTFNGTLTSNTNITLSQNNISGLKFLQGQRVTLSFSTSGTGSISNVGLKQSGNAVFESATSPKTVTVDFGTKTSTTWQAWCMSGTVYNNFNLKVQLELGSTATSYAAYFTPIELCKIGDYQDYIYKDGSDWKIHKAINKAVLNGSENWAVVGSGTAGYYYKATYSGQVYNSAGKSSHYKWYPYLSTGDSADKQGFAVQNGTTADFTIRVRYGAEESVANYATWLSTNNVSVYYIPQTATDTAITNEALIAQLNALLTTARTYAGVNNIFTITPNEQGTIELTYMTEESDDRRDVIVIDSRMRTITLNGTDAYHLLAEGSEFPLLAPGENKLLLRSDTPGDNGYAEVNYKQGYLSI